VNFEIKIEWTYFQLKAILITEMERIGNSLTGST